MSAASDDGEKGDRTRRSSIEPESSAARIAEIQDQLDPLSYEMDWRSSWGHQWVNFTNLPAEHRIALLLVIEAPDVPIGAYSMHVDVLDPSVASRRRASFPVDITITGRVTRITRVLELAVVVDAVGVWTVRAFSDTRIPGLRNNGTAISGENDLAGGQARPRDRGSQTAYTCHSLLR